MMATRPIYEFFKGMIREIRIRNSAVVFHNYIKTPEWICLYGKSKKEINLNI